MNSQALNSLMDITEEEIRIWDLHRLYGWLLTGQGTVIDVVEVRSNEYEVTLNITKTKKQTIGSGRKGVCGMKRANVSCYGNQKITLKPTMKES